MTWLITGANGFIGRHLVETLVRSGADVTCAVRSQHAISQLPPGGDPRIVGDIDQNTDWSEAVKGASVVVHLAGRAHVMREETADSLREFSRVNVGGALSLLRAAEREGVGRLIFVSSVGVLGDQSGLLEFTDETTPAPVSTYGHSKLEAEDALCESAENVEIVILRPPLVYGPGNPGNFKRLLNLVSLGLPLPFASVDNRRSLIYVENLVAAICLAATAQLGACERFLVADPVPVSLPDLVAAMARAMGRKARLFPFPAALLAAGLRLAGRRAVVSALLGNLVVDGSRFSVRVGRVSTVPFMDGLVRTVKWYKESHRGRSG